MPLMNSSTMNEWKMKNYVSQISGGNQPILSSLLLTNPHRVPIYQPRHNIGCPTANAIYQIPVMPPESTYIGAGRMDINQPCFTSAPYNYNLSHDREILEYNNFFAAANAQNQPNNHLLHHLEMSANEDSTNNYDSNVTYTKITQDYILANFFFGISMYYETLAFELWYIIFLCCFIVMAMMRLKYANFSFQNLTRLFYFTCVLNIILFLQLYFRFPGNYMMDLLKAHAIIFIPTSIALFLTICFKIFMRLKKYSNFYLDSDKPNNTSLIVIITTFILMRVVLGFIEEKNRMLCCYSVIILTLYVNNFYCVSRLRQCARCSWQFILLLTMAFMSFSVLFFMFEHNFDYEIYLLTDE